MGRPAKKLKEDRLVTIRFNKPILLVDDPIELDADHMFAEAGSRFPNFIFASKNKLSQVTEPGKNVVMLFSKAKKYLEKQMPCNYIDDPFIMAADSNDIRLKKTMPLATLVEDEIIKSEEVAFSDLDEEDLEALTAPSV